MTTQTPHLPDDEIGRLLRELTEGGHRAEMAVAALYRHYRKPVLVYLCRNGLDEGSAEDVLQAVFLKLVRRSGRWRGEGSASAWFWAIVRNSAMDHHRARKGEVGMGDEAWAQLIESQPAPEAGTDASAELQRCVQKALQGFANAHPERAEAIRLMHLEDWSIAEIAQVLGRTPGATKEFLSQCRKAFKSFIEPCLVWLKP